MRVKPLHSCKCIFIFFCLYSLFVYQYSAHSWEMKKKNGVKLLMLRFLYFLYEIKHHNILGINNHFSVNLFSPCP